MTDAKLIHAFTEPQSSYPPYINVSRLANGSVKVIVRSAPSDREAPTADSEWAVEGQTASITLSEADWRSLAWSVFAETDEREKAK